MVSSYSKEQVGVNLVPRGCLPEPNPEPWFLQHDKCHVIHNLKLMLSKGQVSWWCFLALDVSQGILILLNPHPCSNWQTIVFKPCVLLILQRALLHSALFVRWTMPQYTWIIRWSCRDLSLKSFPSNSSHIGSLNSIPIKNLETKRFDNRVIVE